MLVGGIVQPGLPQQVLLEDDTTCCYALQDKVWVRGPGAEPWEVYVVKADADPLATEADSDDEVTRRPVTAGAPTSCCASPME